MSDIKTFTTLGYGDFAPTGNLARLFCSIESLLGLILSGLFIVSLSKKILRN